MNRYCAINSLSLLIAVAQQELGSINGGTVYALFDYEPHEEDGYDIDGETGLPFLPLIQNDALKIISKGGEQEREEEFWWVAENRLYQKGLVPCTLLGVRLHFFTTSLYPGYLYNVFLPL